jgi:hypothetical protein
MLANQKPRCTDRVTENEAKSPCDPITIIDNVKESGFSVNTYREWDRHGSVSGSICKHAVKAK